MANKTISHGIVHKVPSDLRLALASSPVAQGVWQRISPLARNEWICWVLSAKKEETRARRIKRTLDELSEGIHRPCCWAGCIHR